MRRWTLSLLTSGSLALSLFAASGMDAFAAGNAPQRYYRTAPVRSYSYYPRTTNVWPYYPNYGNNSVGAAYSQAAGMRQGQFFGTFGLRPADARARGAY